MRVYLCDRCGERFATSAPLDPPSTSAGDPLELGLTTKLPLKARGGRVVVVEVDLCGPCVGLLVKWTSQKETEAK